MRRHVLIKSGVEYEDYACNYYEGCQHGCKYCYSRLIKRWSYWRWVEHAQPVLDAVQLLEKDIAKLREKPKDIMVCSSTDPYQPLDRKYGLTRRILETFIDAKLPFSVLTKGAEVIKDIALFADYSNCRVGLTITTLNDDVRRHYEPYSSSVVKRLGALKKLHDAGVRTWVSVEPIFPSLKETNPIDIIEVLADGIADEFVFGKLNYQSAPDDFYREIVPKIISKCQEIGVKFFVKRELRELL